MRVCMDTSALMMPVECDVRVFEELDRLLGGYEPVVPRAVLTELDGLADGGGEEATAASVGRDLAQRCAVLDHEESYADDALVEVAHEGRCEYVVTNDQPLQERCLGEGVPVIGLRGRNKLAITQP
ncbi:PIN domain-containing protein [Halorientalis marina]|jgi:rRNA-processing protein FCF1|uniref:PIN domain-containing protein n=1 Tax=Halorientalis marina TaxID=2931976 RepID=UPI001FF60B43|nr:twitching motility protein PilT [Halorientalis marina]